MSGATGTTNVFRANSLYDPDMTGVGSQPANFDRWMNIYDHYTVIGAKMTVQYAPTTTTDQNPGYVGIYLSDDGLFTSTASVSSLMEQKKNADFPRIIGFGEQIPDPLVMYFSAKKFFGKPVNTIIGDGTYRGTSSANPTEGAFFELYQKAVGGNTPGTFNYLVTIDYIAVLTEPKEDEDA